MKKKLDKTILACLLLLMMISALSIFSASTYLPSHQDSLVIKQLLWYGIGILIVFLILKWKNNVIYRHAYFLYALSCGLLLALLLFADPINNSKCWFVLPGIGSFQPSEFMKIILIITLSKFTDYYFEKRKKPTWKEEFTYLFFSFLLVLIPSILTFLEPDTGVVLIYFVIYLTIVFFSKVRLRWLLVFVLFLLVILGTFCYLYFGQRELFIKLLGTKMFYRIDRLLDWQNQSGLQLENAMAAIGSSGFLGHGFNRTPIYFPESGTDFIFAVFASNFGLLGSLLLLGILLLFDLKLILLSNKKLPTVDRLLLVGTTSMLLYQQAQNIAMTLGLLPITGITLPFISYGGSSLLSYFILIGMILNIFKEAK